MRALLIDPVAQSVKEVDYDGDYRSISKLIDNGGSPFDVRPLHGRQSEVIYFDDEFLLKAENGTPLDYFYLNGLPDPIGGKALIMGNTVAGNSKASKILIEELVANLRYKKLTLKGWTPVSQKKVVHPSLGELTQIIGPRPIFEEIGVASKDGRDIVDLVEDDEAYRTSTEATRQLHDFIGKFMRHDNG